MPDATPPHHEETLRASAPPWRRHSATILRLALGFLFLYAAVLKFLAPNVFFAALQSYELLDSNFAFTLSRALPVAEAVFALWLLSGWKTFPAACVGLGLMLLFSAFLFSAWVRGLEVSCACFGPLDVGQTPAAGLFRNALLTLAFAWLAWRCHQSSTLVRSES
jgi:putative oxidoreductase